MTSPVDIRKRAVQFYKDLYKSEILEVKDDHLGFNFFLPQIAEDVNNKISKTFRLEEFEEALKKM